MVLRSQGVGKFLKGGGAGDSIVWVVNMGPFGVNGKEDRWDAHGVPANDHGEEKRTISIWDMGDVGGRMDMRSSGKPVG